MKTVLAVLLLFVFVLGSSAGPDKTCKEFVSDLTKRQMGGMGKCAKSMTFKNGKDKAAKTMCILKCVMIKEGFLDPEGRMTEEQFKAMTDKEVPDNVKDHAVPLLDKCRVDHAAGLDPSEEFCKSYDPLVKCLLGVLGKLCPS